jgi:aspartyl-tRNA(Asn)/glutamyl-tRNA(Gln) amidotransferase subunit A
VPVAIGTDTAGSVRIPAAYCGIVGFKPALGALPRRGLTRVVPSMETVGVLGRTVADCRLAYEALVGRSVRAAADMPLTIGRLDDLFEAAEPDVAAVVDGALGALAGRHRVGGTRLGWQPRGLGRLFAAELDRTWGTRMRASPADFTAEIRADAERGAKVTDAERHDVLEHFRRARRTLRGRLARFDVLASPTVPHAVPLAGEESVATCTQFTRPFNALGWPAISLPCGADARGLPVGLQLAAPPQRLPALLAAAAAVEAIAEGVA